MEGIVGELTITGYPLAVGIMGLAMIAFKYGTPEWKVTAQLGSVLMTGNVELWWLLLFELNTLKIDAAVMHRGLNVTGTPFTSIVCLRFCHGGNNWIGQTGEILSRTHDLCWVPFYSHLAPCGANLDWERNELFHSHEVSWHLDQPYHTTKFSSGCTQAMGSSMLWGSTSYNIP